MKKVYMAVVESEKERSMEELRDLGVLHLDLPDEEHFVESDAILRKRRIEKARDILNASRDKEEKEISGEDPSELAEKVIETREKLDDLRERLAQAEKEKSYIEPWGNFNPDDIAALREKGVDIRLYELTGDQIEELPASIKVFYVSRGKSINRVACVLTDYKDEPSFEEFNLPGKSLKALKGEIGDISKVIEDTTEELESLGGALQLFEDEITVLEEKIEFETTLKGMITDARVAVIKGYLPEKRVRELQKTASSKGWGLIIMDPEKGDMVPTLIENPGLIRAIRPVFNLLGTLPGYAEYDISFFFLLFFSIFWAMIISDAGYGFIFLALTIIGRLIFRKASFEPFLLLFLTSITTIAWGALSGTWFGVEALSRHELFSWMIVPQIASFVQDPSINTDKIIMHLCFIIGAVHLSMAHLMRFKKMFPSLRSLSQLGWLSVLWGLYFLIRSLVLKIESGDITYWLTGGGLAFVILFSEQEGNFLKGVKNGMSNLIIVFLDSISFFSDIISYVRLFAVGLATVEVARSFNVMASNMGFQFPAVLGSALVLFFGHTLNIILGCMSLIVHGVRLNMLEFSGHLNMEWSGFSYNPFRKKTASE